MNHNKMFLRFKTKIKCGNISSKKLINKIQLISFSSADYLFLSNFLLIYFFLKEIFNLFLSRPTPIVDT